MKINFKSICVLFLTLAAVFLFNISKIGCSFWLDELSTFFFIKDGIWLAIDRTKELPTQSPFFYALVAAWKYLAGTSELILRLPNLIFMMSGFLVVACYLYQILGFWSAWFFFSAAAVTLPRFDEYLSLRPYGLLCLLQTLSVVFLYNQKGIKTRKDSLFFLIITVLSLHTHYLALLIVPLQLFIFYYVGSLSLSSIIRFSAIWIVAISTLLLSPKQIQPLFESISYYPKTYASDLFTYALISNFPFSPLPCLILYLFTRLKTVSKLNDNSQSVLRFGGFGLAWGLIPLVVFFCLEMFIGHALYYRYVQWSYLGLICSAACCLSLIFPCRNFKLYCFTLILFFTTFVTYMRPVQLLCGEDWRQAGKMLQQSSNSQDFVFIQGGFDSANDPAWLTFVRSRNLEN